MSIAGMEYDFYLDQEAERDVAMHVKLKQTGRLLKKGLSVGRKRTRKPAKELPRIERQLALRLSELVGDNAVQVAESCGVSADAVRKWCAGDSFPVPSRWPKLALALGLDDYRDLFPQL